MQTESKVHHAVQGHASVGLSAVLIKAEGTLTPPKPPRWKRLKGWISTIAAWMAAEAGRQIIKHAVSEGWQWLKDWLPSIFSRTGRSPAAQRGGS